MSKDGLELDGRGAEFAGWNSAVVPLESQDSMSAAAIEMDKGGEAQQAVDGQRYEVCFEATYKRLDTEPELYNCGAHVLDEVVPRRVYKSTHMEAATGEKWSKVEFKIEVSEDESFFNCECGYFQHAGLVCCHVLQVSLWLTVIYVFYSCLQSKESISHFQKKSDAGDGALPVAENTIEAYT